MGEKLSEAMGRNWGFEGNPNLRYCDLTVAGDSEENPIDAIWYHCLFHSLLPSTTYVYYIWDKVEVDKKRSNDIFFLK